MRRCSRQCRRAGPFRSLPRDRWNFPARKISSISLHTGSGRVQNGTIVIRRKEPDGAISTTCCGFGTAGLYRQLRSVKNCFCWKWGSRDFRGGWRVRGMVTVVHIVWVTRQLRRHKGEQFTPELLWPRVRTGGLIERSFRDLKIFSCWVTLAMFPGDLNICVCRGHAWELRNE